MSSLNLKNIYKVYPSGVTAVSDFNLDIEDKEFIVFVGPSGCGKSTTLRMIAGLEEISDGELYIDGLLVNDIAPKDRDIAMVFQNYALYPHMTVYDNMAFGLKLRKMPKEEIDARVKEAARILGIEMYLSRKPKALSGGQRQRVALGRAIVREPKVFLLDEPLSNLDAKLRSQMRTEISKLHNRLATTFIYVTHDQVEAMTMGTRIVVMKDGYMQQVDEPLNLYDYPINQFVAGFIGTPQMNFFNAVLTGTKNKVYVEFGNDKVLLPKEKVALICNLDQYLNTGKPVIFGIRPENIDADEVALKKAKANEAFIKVGVEFVEDLGAETILYCKTSDIEESGDIIDVKANLIAKVDSRSVAREGDDVELALDMARCHLFDKETELTIVARTEDGKKELEELQYNRLNAERIKAEEQAEKEAEEAAKLAAKLEKKNNLLKKFGLAKREDLVPNFDESEETVEEVVAEEVSEEQREEAEEKEDKE